MFIHKITTIQTRSNKSYNLILMNSATVFYFFYYDMHLLEKDLFFYKSSFENGFSIGLRLF